MTRHEQWQAPPELAGSSPRPVRLTAAGKAAAGAAISLLAGALLGGSWLYVAAMQDQVRFRSLGERSIPAEAEIAELRRTRGENTRYLVTYRFSAGGRNYRKQARVRRGEWEQWRTGSRLGIRHLRSDPGVSWIPGHEPQGIPLWVVPVTPAVLALSAWLIVRAVRKQWRMLSEGRPAPARVTHSERYYRSHGGGRYVYYEFRILSGAVRRGRYQTTRAAPTAGTQMTILYYPDDPQSQAPYPLSLVRVG